MANNIFHTWAIPNLSQASGHSRAQFDPLQSNPIQRCYFGDCLMSYPTLRCYDLSQAYEEMKHDILIAYVKYVLKH
eukprot:1494414-Karenia_brevis.AAC.1